MCCVIIDVCWYFSTLYFFSSCRLITFWGRSDFFFILFLQLVKIFSVEPGRKINRIHHGWSVEIGKSQPEGPSVPVGNEARRVSHWNDGPEG